MHRNNRLSAALSIFSAASLIGFSAFVGLNASTVHAQIRFKNASASSGIEFKHRDGSGGQRYIVEYVASGMVSFDYDGDGLQDLYFLNGGQLQGTKYEDPPTNRLFRNLGNLQFVDVTLMAGVGDQGHSLGGVAGDLDNDGDQDLFVNNFGNNVLYQNQGDGTFAKMEVAGLTTSNRVGAGACLLDADNDGNLDLFVANYVNFNYSNHVQRSHRGHSVYPSPKDFAPQSDQLFRSDGQGGFEDVSEKSGVSGVAGTGMGAISFDFDHDGDSDIFVCNDVMPNFLYQNEGQGAFIENGLLSGVAVDFAGVLQGSMGVDCGDYDLDGNIDLIVTSFQDEMPTLYRNSGLGFFEDVTVRAGELNRAAPDVTWGVSFSDFDNDSFPDLFMASGHLQDNIRDTDDTQSYSAKNLWYENQNGKFRLLEEGVLDVPGKEVSRGSIATDLDADGDIDVVVLNCNSAASILENVTPANHHWLQIRLSGTESQRDGIGSRVIVHARHKLTQQVIAGRSYQGHCGLDLHFGLGTSARVDQVEVHWSSGRRESFPANIDSRTILVEGTGEEMQ